MFCDRPCCWSAPELGDGVLRVLRCPELFFECKKECRPGFCTLPPHCIHPALSHCSGPKNLGSQRRERERENDNLVSIFRQLQPGDEERTVGEQSHLLITGDGDTRMTMTVGSRNHWLSFLAYSTDWPSFVFLHAFSYLRSLHREAGCGG